MSSDSNESKKQHAVASHGKKTANKNHRSSGNRASQSVDFVKKDTSSSSPKQMRKGDFSTERKRSSKQNKNTQTPKTEQTKKKKKTPQQNNPDIAKKSIAVKANVKPPIPEIVPPPEEKGKMRFTDLPLSIEVKAAVQDLEFAYCTEIQRLALPFALEGRDLAAKAQTGTGKTAAFLASLITRFQNKPIEGERKHGAPRALVLAPTRELAIQIHKDAIALSKYTDLNPVVIFGGMDHEKQRHQLDAAVDILIGTPGRILDYLKCRDLLLSDTEILVIDEADRMLDMGFIPDVRRIVFQLPRPGKRQTMLFSATLEHDILRLVESWMVDPQFVESEPEHVITDLIEQRFYAVLDEQKIGFLMYVIQTEKPERMLIFGNRKDKNIQIASKLYSYGENVELLSGDVAQEKRLKILERFRTGETKILVATDVAARGIHIDGITHVVNYDLPEQADDYVHRIGRTGRAGEKGISISFVCEFGAFQLPAIEQFVGSEIKTIQPSPDMFITPKTVRKSIFKEEHHSSHGGGGGRPASHTGYSRSRHR